jgi:hypothetical protein
MNTLIFRIEKENLEPSPERGVVFLCLHCTCCFSFFQPGTPFDEKHASFAPLAGGVQMFTPSKYRAKK